MSRLEEKPYIVSWNLTSRCNLLCPHCYIEADERAGKELTGKEAMFVIDELSYLNNQLMLVLSGGEPMLRDDIFDIVEYASQSGFITVLGSNGTLLTREKLWKLKDAGLKGIGISIDSIFRGNHDSFRGLEGAWELSMSALASSREVGLETQLDVTLTDSNVEEIDEFIELGVTMGAKAVNFFFLVCTGRAMKTDITTKNYDSALRQIARRTSKERRLMVRARCAPHIYRLMHGDSFPIQRGMRGCLAGRSYMRIDPEGNITPCPYMPLVVGNIKHVSLTTIWEESSVLKLLREGTCKGRCGVCEFIEICGGCRARALAEKGDVMEEDTLCTYMPEGKDKIELNDHFESELMWHEDAKERIKKVPLFMQGVILKMIESRARQLGISVISSEFLDRMKSDGYHKNNKT